MKLAYTDLFGLKSFPQFSGKLVKELTDLRSKSYDQASFEKVRKAHIDRINKDLTDELNAIFEQAADYCRSSTSHKPITFARVEEQPLILQGSANIVRNESRRNRFIAILDLEFNTASSGWILNTKLRPAYTHFSGGVIISPNGNFYPVSPVSSVYLIYRLSDDAVNQWRMHG